MLTVLILSICSLTEEKSISVVSSSSFNEGGAHRSSRSLAKQHSGDSFEGTALSASPQPRTSFHVDFTMENGTEIIAGRRTIFEVIPADYLCDFCAAVIDKLKQRQYEEGADFEKNMLDECWKYNGTEKDDGNVCELINKVNIDRLKSDDKMKICVDEKMCPDKQKELDEIKEKEQQLLKEEAKRKQEEEVQKKDEEIEHIKAEASRLEYEKRRAEEERVKTEKSRISSVHSETGDDEYVVDEVSKSEDDKNDYLEHPAEKPGDFQVNNINRTTVRPRPVKAYRESSKVSGSILSTPRLQSSQKDRARTPSIAVKLPGRRISGSASSLPKRWFVDRTVQLKLDVADPQPLR